jgi:hypothetical protein
MFIFMKRSLLAVFLVSLLALAVTGVQAQVTTATLVGTVTDTTGAVIPNAQVTALNVDTNTPHTVQTNGDGAYRVEFLPVGSYKLEVTATGFKAYNRTGIELTVAQIGQADVIMQIGKTGETVEVTDALPLINVTNPEIGRTVQNQEISQLPLVNRNVYTLLTLTPGVQRVASDDVVLGYPEQRTLINGGVDGGAGSVNYYLDGGNNMTGLRNTGNSLPNPDAIQEFRVQTNSYSAEYGRFANGVVNVVTKSGTNNWHGSAFEFVRNTIFNANDWGNTTTPKPPLHRNQFGATLGGPIMHDKTFFFFSYSGLRQITNPFLNGATVPTVAERNGDFSQSAVKPIDPATAPKNFFPSNLIPVGRRDLTSMYILNNFVPLPNTVNPITGILNQWQGFISTFDNRDEGLIKIDHALTAHHQLAASLFNTHGSNDRSGGGNLPWSLQRADWRQYNANLSDTWTLNDHMINQIWFNYTRNFGGRLNVPGTSLADLSIAAGAPVVGNGLFNIQGTRDLPQIAVTGFFTLGQSIAGPTAGTNFYSLRDVFSYTRGRHSLKWGVEVSVDKDIQDTLLNNYGVFNFNGSITSSNTGANRSTGNALADFELGSPNSLSQDAPVRGYTNSWYTALFLQDDIRVNNRLTLNLGLRYDLQTPPTDSGHSNRESTFVPGPEVLLPGAIVQSTVNPSAPPGMLFANDPGVPRGIAQTRKSYISPRIGFAWDLLGDGKTSIRGGAGLFYGSASGNQWNTTANFEPFATRLTLSNGGNAATGALLSQPYRGLTSIPFPYNGQFFPNATIFGPDLNFKWPYTYQLNFSVQHQFTKNLSIMAAYVGSLSHNLPFATDINAPIITPTATTAAANVLSRRPYTIFYASTPSVVPFGPILQMRSNQTADYHGFQLSATKRMGSHFSLSGFYTYSKTLESLQLQNNTTQGGAQDMRNLSLDRGRTDDDMRHQFVMSGLWDLSYYNGGSSIARWVLNGWNIDPIVNIHSGLPFTITEGSDLNLDGTNNDRAFLLPGANPHLSNQSAAMWFNTAAFGNRITPITGFPIVGNTARNFLDGPGFVEVDTALSRNFSLTERFKMEFRAEALNVFNHANLNNPGATVPASLAAPGNFGAITSAQTTRRLQLGLRLMF